MCNLIQTGSQEIVYSVTDLFSRVIQLDKSTEEITDFSYFCQSVPICCRSGTDAIYNRILKLFQSEFETLDTSSNYRNHHEFQYENSRIILGDVYETPEIIGKMDYWRVYINTLFQKFIQCNSN